MLACRIGSRGGQDNFLSGGSGCLSARPTASNISLTGLTQQPLPMFTITRTQRHIPRPLFQLGNKIAAIIRMQILHLDDVPLRSAARFKQDIQHSVIQQKLQLLPRPRNFIILASRHATRCVLRNYTILHVYEREARFRGHESIVWRQARRRGGG